MFFASFAVGAEGSSRESIPAYVNYTSPDYFNRSYNYVPTVELESEYAQVKDEVKSIFLYDKPSVYEPYPKVKKILPAGAIAFRLSGNILLVKGQLWYESSDSYWVRSDQIEKLEVPKFRGLKNPTKRKNVAWAKQKTVLYRNPYRKSLLKNSLGQIYRLHRGQPIFVERTIEIRGKVWAKFEGYWVMAEDLNRVVYQNYYPKGVKKNSRWMAINLTEQTMVAYEGLEAVFATVLSGGIERRPTVQGVFKVQRLKDLRTMTGGSGELYYRVQDIPWVIYFHRGYSLHATYWHNYFGMPRSHGCLNVSPSDAKWLHSWVKNKFQNVSVYIYE